MLNSSLDGLWLHLALKHTKLHWSFHSYELRCLHWAQLSFSLSGSFVTYRMQCQTSYYARHNINMHAHLHGKSNAKQVLNLTCQVWTHCKLTQDEPNCKPWEQPKNHHLKLTHVHLYLALVRQALIHGKDEMQCKSIWHGNLHDVWRI